MQSNFETCRKLLLVHEGGYTNHPSDPGGPTKFGITIDDYRRYVKTNETAADVHKMKLDEAKIIIAKNIGMPNVATNCPPDYAVFDYGVNSGIGRSGKVLRRTLRLPDNTSVVTNEVVAAAR